MNIFFTSDTHYNHKNIVRGTSEWEAGEGPQRTRDFDTLEEHNKALVTSINSVVKEDDILYHLGDWSFGGINSIWEFRKQLNCKEIHLIFGNHDEHIEANKEITILKDESLIKFLKTYSYVGDKITFKLQDLFASVSHSKQLNLKIDCQKTGKFGKQMFCLSHYAHRVWNKSHKGSIMLYGHSHGTLDEMKPEFANPTWIGDNYFIKNYKTMDVGVDTNNLYPYHMDEILEIMKKRDVLLNVDHHSKNTN